MTRVFFEPSDKYLPQAKAMLEKVQTELLAQFPTADVQDMGSTSVPGLLTKGDLDINMRVDADDFDKAIEYLKRHYHEHQVHNWNDGFASFLDDEDNNELPLGIHITVKGHKEDKFIKQRELLQSRPDLVKEYNELKQKYNGKEMDEYRKAKWKFIEDNLENKGA